MALLNGETNAFAIDEDSDELVPTSGTVESLRESPLSKLVRRRLEGSLHSISMLAVVEVDTAVTKD